MCTLWDAGTVVAHLRRRGHGEWVRWLHEHRGQRGVGHFSRRLWLLVGYSGNYNTPFIPMVALLALGALLWLQAAPTRELFPEEPRDESRDERTPMSYEATGVR